MIVRRVTICKKNGVIPPDNPLAAYGLGQFLEDGKHLFFFVGNSRFYIFSVTGKGKLEIIVIERQHIKSRDHRLRVLGPEYDTVDHLRRQADFADLAEVHGIAHTQESFFDSIVKPPGIVVWDVRSSAGAYDHGNPF